MNPWILSLPKWLLAVPNHPTISVNRHRQGHIPLLGIPRSTAMEWTPKTETMHSLYSLPITCSHHMHPGHRNRNAPSTFSASDDGRTFITSKSINGNLQGTFPMTSSTTSSQRDVHPYTNRHSRGAKKGSYSFTYTPTNWFPTASFKRFIWTAS